MFQGVIVLVLAPVIGVTLTWDQVLILIGLMLMLAAMMTSLGDLDRGTPAQPGRLPGVSSS